MWLRWVVSNLLNQIAEDKMRHAVDRAKHLVEPALRGRRGVAPSAEEGLDTHPDIVLIFALGIESGGFVDQMTDVVTTECATFLERSGRHRGRPLVVAESGVGQEAAMQATDDIIKVHQPSWVVSAGFAGALVSEIQPGHILMADSVIDRRGHPLEIGLQISPEAVAETPSLHVGRLLTVDQLIRRREEKESLAAEFQAIACDMETMAIAQVCRRRHVRFLSVRVISDGLEDNLPREVEHMLEQSSFAGKLGAATRAVFHRPGSVKDMWKLRETAIRASDRLAKFLVGIVPQLVNSES